ncbi:Secreted protein [Phytophthora cinnamomi]|uniref:Secreted protein n=1 Tax=Phytophthora cinnamomi TaxID=4785 RepID=UPI00355978E0|nr:Secreted protein [Phytophthora cinnamomi]
MHASPAAPTSLNSKGEMPPAEVCYLTTASFPDGAKKAKGDYNPPQAHLLAASRMLAREREIFRETVCFPNRSAPLDAKTPCLPGSQEDCSGTGTTQTGILTLRELNSATESVSRTVTPPGSVYQSSSRGVKFPTEEEDRLRTGTAPRPSHLRPIISVNAAAAMHSNARERSNLLRVTRRATLAQAMAKLRVPLPPDNYPLSRPGVAGPEFLLDTPLRKALSEYARRSGASLPTFVEMVRGQRVNDYRPNKSLVPVVLNEVRRGYEHLEELQKIVHGGVEVRLSKTPPRQVQRPPNHRSARDRLNVLRKNIRKKQDAGRCLVLDRDLLKQWPEIIINPFGVVDKGGEDSSVTGRTIHDLSYPEGTSINDCTDQDNIIKPEYTHSDAVATEIVKPKRAHPNARVCVMAGDVASAFRNISISIHSNSVYLFAGHIEEDDVIVIELAAPFGWTGSPVFYEIAGGTVAYVHGSHTTDTL